MSETRPSHHTPEYLDFLNKLESLKHGEKLLYDAVVRNEVSFNDAEKLIHQAYDNIAQHPGAVSACVLFVRENNTLDRLVLDKKEHIPTAEELAAKTAAFVAAQPKIHPVTVPAAKSLDDERYQSAAYQESTKAGAKHFLISGLVGFGMMGAAFLGHYLHQKGVNVTALYGSVLGTALLGHGMNEYEAWRKAQPKIEYAEPIPAEKGGISARIGASLVSLCAVIGMMSGSSTSYDHETAKPHKALHMVERANAGLLFANDLPQ